MIRSLPLAALTRTQPPPQTSGGTDRFFPVQPNSLEQNPARLSQTAKTPGRGRGILEPLGAKLCLAGHGRPFRDVQGHIDANRREVNERIERVRTALQNGGPKTPFEIVPALMGVAFKLWRPSRLERLSVVFYLAMGWIGVVAFDPFFHSLATPTLVLLLAGGVVYSAGVAFQVGHAIAQQRFKRSAITVAGAGQQLAAVGGSRDGHGAIVEGAIRQRGRNVGKRFTHPRHL